MLNSLACDGHVVGSDGEGGERKWRLPPEEPNAAEAVQTGLAA